MPLRSSSALPPLRFGATNTPAGTSSGMPAQVPDKFARVWDQLPPCCRNFYENPGQGCCSGMNEPQPRLMSEPPADHFTTTTPADPNHAEITPSADQAATATPTSPNRLSRLISGLGDWLRQALRIVWTDLKALFSAPAGGKSTPTS